MNHSSTVPFVGAIFLLGILTSCNSDEVTIVVDDSGPTAYRNAFFPLAVGNRWDYVDSLFTSADTQVGAFSVSIVSFRTDTFGIWWKFQDSRYTGGYLYEYLERNDSVYSFQHNFRTPVASLEYIPPRDFDTSSFHTLHGGDILLMKTVVNLRHNYSTPARSFDSCASYYYRMFEERQWDVIRPRIGPVGYDTQVDSFANHGAWFRRIRLTSYSLKQ